MKIENIPTSCDGWYSSAVIVDRVNKLIDAYNLHDGKKILNGKVRVSFNIGGVNFSKESYNQNETLALRNKLIYLNVPYEMEYTK